MNSHDYTGEITKQAATRAAVLIDQQVLRLLKDNGLEHLFTKAINAVDPDDLEREGYMLIPVVENREMAEKNGISFTETTYTFKLVKIMDSTTFTLQSSVDISAIKMKEG